MMTLWRIQQAHSSLRVYALKKNAEEGQVQLPPEETVGYDTKKEV